MRSIDIHLHIWSCTVLNDEYFILTLVTAPPKKPAAPAGGPGGGKKNKKKTTLNADHYLFTISLYVCKRSIFFFFFNLENTDVRTFQSSCTQLWCCCCCCPRQTSAWRIFLIPPKLRPRLCPKLPPAQRLRSNPNPNQVREFFDFNS